MIINEPEIAASAIKTVKKLWGVEYWILNTELYCLKYLKVIPGYQCSIHAHKKKDETFVGLSGSLLLTIHDKESLKPTMGMSIEPGMKYRIQPKQFHSFQANNVSWIAEVSTHHDDADVIRLQESRKLDAA